MDSNWVCFPSCHQAAYTVTVLCCGLLKFWMGVVGVSWYYCHLLFKAVLINTQV